MKKIQYIFFVLCGLGAVSCSNYFDEHQLGNVDPSVTDIRPNMTYELTENDYAKIAKLQVNIDSATLHGEQALEELAAIATEKAFTETASADMYVPALMQNMFPYLDNGTFCDVTYRYREGKSTRVQPFTTATGYTLETKDYEAIWQKRGIEYLTPASADSVNTFLKTLIPTAKIGKIVVLSYNYSANEPEPSEGSEMLPYALPLSQFMKFPDDKEHEFYGVVGTIKSKIYGRFYLVDGQDSVYVYELANEEGNNKIWKSLGIEQGDSIRVRGFYNAEKEQIVNAVYVSHSPASIPARAPRYAANNKQINKVNTIYQLTDEGWVLYTNEDLKVAEALPQHVYEMVDETAISDTKTIEKYLRITYPYAKEDDIYLIAYRGVNGMTADEWIYDGSDFILTTGYINEVMSFQVKNDIWIANISTYLQTKFVGEGVGKFIMQNVALDGLSYVWRYQALYGMTASGYVSGAAHKVDGWLISPKIKLKKAKQPQMTYDNALKFGNATDNPKWLSVMITTNWTGDVTTSEWTKLPFPEDLPPGTDWVFRPSGVFDLSAYNGQTVVIAFRYDTTIDGTDLTSVPTWEIQNLLIAEPEE